MKYLLNGEGGEDPTFCVETCFLKNRKNGKPLYIITQNWVQTNKAKTLSQGTEVFPSETHHTASNFNPRQ